MLYPITNATAITEHIANRCQKINVIIPLLYNTIFICQSDTASSAEMLRWLIY